MNALLLALTLAAAAKAPAPASTAHPAASHAPPKHHEAPASQPARALPTEPTSGPVCVAEVTASINPGTGAYIIQSIQTAKTMGCGVLVLTLDTPGGLLSTTRDIVKAELSAPL